MRTAGLVTRGRVTLGRGIVVIAVTEAYRQTYRNLQTTMLLQERRMRVAYCIATGSSAACYIVTRSSGIAILVSWSKN